MKRTRLIFFEQTVSWSAWTRSRVDVRVYETRSLANCWEYLEAAPASLLVLQLTSSNIDSMIEFVIRVRRYYPAAHVAFVGGREFAGYEPILREAGAVATCFSLRSLELLVRITTRHDQLTPVEAEPVGQRIRRELPWAGNVQPNDV